MAYKIMIVDDEPDVVYVIEQNLLKEGYKVVKCYDGLDALAKVGSEKPDLILLDIMMPKLDGHAVNSRLKENPATASIPVIVITAHGNLRKLLQVRDELAVSGYFEKPFPVSLLKEKIKELLNPDGTKSK